MSAVDQIITADGHKLKVIAFLKNKGLSSDRARIIFTYPHYNLSELLRKKIEFRKYYGYVTDKRSYNNLMEVARDTLERSEAWRPAPKIISIQIKRTNATQINQITSGVRIGSLVIAAIALLAAGVGIMNIMWFRLQKEHVKSESESDRREES